MATYLMIKLTPITKEQYELGKLKEQLASMPTPTNGRNGRDGKDGVTKVVTHEVLANKEALLEKEEFEKFKKQVMDMEDGWRVALANSTNYFPGGGISSSPLVSVIEVDEDTTITSSQIDVTKINVILVTVPNITVTLPVPTADKFILVQQGYSGTEDFFVTREDI